MFGPLRPPPAETGSYPVRPGCLIRPLIDGAVAFDQICEAIEQAQDRVWGTVAFFEHEVPMPGDRGSMLDVLQAASQRGVDVRVIFWRSSVVGADEHFPGTAAQRSWLDGCGYRFRARWDALPGNGCVHQKSWLIDAGGPGEIAFVGGINLDHGSVPSRPGHGAGETGFIHDVYAELRGPAGTDVHHNFVQRWNGASERNESDGVWPDGSGDDDLAFPSRLSDEAGAIPVQITRTVQPGRYHDPTPTVGGLAHDIAGGETSVYEQYIDAIDGAERSIYIEDQVLGSSKVLAHLGRALDRGVGVLLVVPGECHPTFAEARHNPVAAPFYALLEGLGRHGHFTLAALAAPTPDGPDAEPISGEIYIHSKIMLVDDVWATIGSTNTATQSFRYDTEMNASFWDESTVKAMRVALFAEHLGVDAAELEALDDVAAFARFARQARANRRRRADGETTEGLAYALDPATYGTGPVKKWSRPAGII